jgi:hypothetical protein
MAVDLRFVKQHINEDNDKVMFNVFVGKLFAVFLLSQAELGLSCPCYDGPTYTLCKTDVALAVFSVKSCNWRTTLHAYGHSC